MKYLSKSGYFWTGTSSDSRLNSYIGNYPSLYTKGSKGPLIRAILDHFSLFWHILHHTDRSSHQNVGLFRQEPPQTMGSAQPWPINLSFYTIGSNRPLIRAIFDNFSLFWHSLHHTDQSTHQEVDLFGQEHPQTVGATQPWSINPSFYTIGSKGPLIRAIFDNFSLFFYLFCTIQMEVFTIKWVFSDRNLIRQCAQLIHRQLPEFVHKW